MLSVCGGPDYVEIGVAEGKTFTLVDARRKIAIDPDFKYDWRSLAKENESYYEITSDEFFATNDIVIDGVVYVDGFHTYDQSLRDINNCIERMSDRSIILVDDCSPGLEIEARELSSGEDPFGTSWCGDVWKSIVHLRATRNDLRITSSLQHPGLACITFGVPDSILDIDLEWLRDATYRDLFFSREELLNGRR